MSRFSDVEVKPKQKRHELGIPEDKPIVGTVSRLEPIKGQKYFIQACALVALKHPETIFVIIGDGTLKAKLLGFFSSNVSPYHYLLDTDQPHENAHEIRYRLILDDLVSKCIGV